MTFLNQFLLWGMILASVPIIIHLLSRRRFIRVQWAPMHYLKLTLRKHRKRLRIEQWLLLLLRTLFIVFLILAVARPIMSGGGLMNWLGGRGHTARILVLDDSMSMGHALEGQSAFNRATALMQRFIESLGSSDSLTLVLASNPEKPVFREALTDDPAPLQSAVANLRQTSAPVQWSSTLSEVTTLMNTLAFPMREVTIITDLRRPGWDRELGDVLKAWDPDSTSFNIIDVGRAESGNVAILDFALQNPVALVDAPLVFRAVLRNDEDQAVNGLQATMNLGTRSQSVLLPELPPGKEVPVMLEARFDAPGRYPVSLSLPSDPLQADNTRWLVVDVKKELRIHLVDGEPGVQPFTGEVDFLSLAFSVGEVPWSVESIIDTEWLAEAGERPDLLILANVAAIPPSRVERLMQQVEEGMGLMIFPGEQMDVDAYNRDLYRDGDGLLPGKIIRVFDEKVTGLVVEPQEGSPLNVLTALAPAALARINASQYIGVEAGGEGQQVRVLARWNDADNSPAVLERARGAGRVMLWTISADRAWSDWPIEPTFVLCMREATAGMARSRANPRNFLTGQKLRHTLVGEDPPEDAVVVKPGEDKPLPLVVSSNVLEYAYTSMGGIYNLNWENAQGRTRSETFAISPAPQESLLDRIGDDEITTLAGGFAPAIIHQNTGNVDLAERGSEIWRTLIVLVLIVLAVESMLACYVGRRR